MILAFEIPGGIAGLIGAIITTLTVLGVGAGVIIYYIKVGFDHMAKRQVERDKEDSDRKARLTEEEGRIRETLLSRYKEMYELEKERSQREIKNVCDKLEKLTNEFESLIERDRLLRQDYDKLKIDYNEVVRLNITYQHDKSKDAGKIADLNSQIQTLNTEMSDLRAKVDRQ